MRSAFRNISMVAGVAVFLLGIFQAGISKSSQSEGQTRWQTHDMSRPQPRVVIPGEESTQDRPGRPPSDAIVLFDGKSLSNWQGADGGPAKWKVGNGYFEVVPKTGDIYTKQAFRDYQLHVEWLSPPWTPGNTYDPGNSGVYLASFYEVQIVQLGPQQDLRRWASCRHVRTVPAFGQCLPRPGPMADLRHRLPRRSF